jgi:hypothetical protein
MPLDDSPADANDSDGTDTVSSIQDRYGHWDIHCRWIVPGKGWTK